MTSARKIATVAAVAATPFAWLFLASNIYCVGINRPDLFVPPFTQWLQVAPYWRVNWWTTLWVVVSAAAPTFFLAIVVWWLLSLRKGRANRPNRYGSTGWASPADMRSGGLPPLEPGVSDNHGHAAFATTAQTAKRFSGPGCLIGAADRKVGSPLLFDNVNSGPGHSMVFAGPGSWKTSSAITRLWQWNGPRVVFDPSCEIGPIMTEALQASGCKVVAIGLTGQGINALDWIDTEHPEADAHIRSAVDWIYNEGAATREGGAQGKDPFWSTWGRALVTCLLAHMLYHRTPEVPKTLAALRQGIAMPESDMPTLLAGINRTSFSRMARDLAGGLMNMRAAETFSGIYANSFAATEWLSVGAYADVVSGDAMRTADILNSNTVVFVQLPLRTLLATPAVGRAVMGAFFNAMFHADGEGVADRILFELDEAWILGRLKEIMLCHTTARKYRGCVQTLWQSEAQLEDTWGREGAKTMRDTVSWRSYNAVQDGDVAERLSRDLGEHGVMAWSEGTNSGNQRNPMAWMGSKSTGNNASQHEIRRRLIKADEIMRAPADDMFVLARDFGHPIRCCSAPYFRYPGIAGKMNISRFAAE